MSIVLEAVVVGLALAILMGLSNWVFPIQGSRDAVVTGFVLGSLFHLVCEMTKVNRWYCTHGTACAPMTRA